MKKKTMKIIQILAFILVVVAAVLLILRVTGVLK